MKTLRKFSGCWKQKLEELPSTNCEKNLGTFTNAFTSFFLNFARKIFPNLMFFEHK